MPHLPKKSPSDDDPFWDCWDDEPTAKENRAPLRRTKTKKKTTTNAAACCDLFGLDGFGDSWNYKPSAKFDCDDDPLPEDDFSSAEFDWGPSAARMRGRMAEQAKRKKEREEWLESGVKKVREAKAKAKVEAEMKAAHAKAEAKAKAEADAAQAKIAAEEKWQFKVKQATECLAHAEPVRALNSLYSLSHENEKLLDCIDEEQKKEVGQLYTAIYDRQELLKSLSTRFEDCSPDTYSNGTAVADRSHSEPDESSTIGGDTVKVGSPIDCQSSNEEWKEESFEIGTGNKTIAIVDSVFHEGNGSQINESSSERTVGGDTVKLSSSN